MTYLRCVHEGRAVYGQLSGDEIQLIEGDLFGAYRLTDTKIPFAGAKLLAPVAPPNIIAIGLNYKRHAAESGMGSPDRPVIFIKATTSLVGPNDPIRLPTSAPDEVDYEAELAVVIGKTARDVKASEALSYVLGYTCANDVSARDCQIKQDKQWARGKSFDTFCPMGPVIVTDLDGDNLPIRSRLNGRVMQASNTSDMFFCVPRLIEYCSRDTTLLPGTVILTGTPEGVGFARKPPVYLRPGDTIEIEIDGIGTLVNPVT